MLWMEHQRRDAFWKHGSVCENYDAIQCPVLTVSGWVDGYTAAVFRNVENLKPPAKGIAGPWGHKYPACRRSGSGNRLSPGMQALVGPLAQGQGDGRRERSGLAAVAPGLRKAEAAFRRAQGPLDRPAGMAEQEHQDREALSGRRHARGKARQGEAEIDLLATDHRPRLRANGAPTRWARLRPELALDQREDDAGSLVFDGEPSEETAGDRRPQPCPPADRSPTSSRRRSRSGSTPFIPTARSSASPMACSNLSHRDSHEKPAAARSRASIYDVDRRTERDRPDDSGRSSAADSRSRPAIGRSPGRRRSSRPSPSIPSQSSIEMPVLTSERGLARVNSRPASNRSRRPDRSRMPGAETRHVVQDIEKQRTNFIIKRNDGTYVIDEIGTEISYHQAQGLRASAGAILMASARSSACTAHYRRGDWDARVETELVMTIDKTPLPPRGQGPDFRRRQALHRARLQALVSSAIMSESKESLGRDNLTGFQVRSRCSGPVVASDKKIAQGGLI